MGKAKKLTKSEKEFNELKEWNDRLSEHIKTLADCVTQLDIRLTDIEAHIERKQVLPHRQNKWLLKIENRLAELEQKGN